jgi:hypothetical protein
MMTFKFLTLGDHVRLLDDDFGPCIAASVADSAGRWGVYALAGAPILSERTATENEHAILCAARTAATVAFNAYPVLRER